MAVLTVLVSGILLATYLLFARAWMQWQSEEALYCAAVGQGASVCQRTLEDRVREFLPWGTVQARVWTAESGWYAEVRWKYSQFAFHERKALTPKMIVGNRDLRW
jgi:hypothetical protein